MSYSQDDPLNPTTLLQTAIEELDVFTQSESSGLKIGEDGRLAAAHTPPLKRVMEFARAYIVPIFSSHIKQEQEKKLGQIKKALLQARDIVKSHSALIEKFKEGDEAQQHLAAYALSAIQRYNAVVGANPMSHTVKQDLYNYERRCLLQDQEIKGQLIELPRAVSIKYDSHAHVHPAQKMLKELSQTLLIGAVHKSNADLSSTHKKTMQFMMDTFHMKAIRLIQSHLSQRSVIADILPLVKRTPIEVDEESCEELTIMRQLLETGPGCHILVTGCFNRHLSDPKFMTMPILDSFRLSFQMTHSGFPYPSQHTGWSLSDKWIEAYPLRTDQVPLFQQIDKKKKQLAQQLLFEHEITQKACRRAQIKREVFDEHRALFLPLHHQLQLALKEAVPGKQENDSVLEAFYQEAAQAPSAFDVMVQTQQQLLDMFVHQPLRALEDEWLSAGSTPLRLGSPQEKFQMACRRLEQHRCAGQKRLDMTHVRHAYILQQGEVLGKIFQPIGLQYQSEKMGFSPPLLNDLERKLQASAFQQLLTFMDECASHLDHADPDRIKCDLLKGWSRDLQLLEMATIEEDHSLPAALVDELERYFNSRFSAPKNIFSQQVI